MSFSVSFQCTCRKQQQRFVQRLWPLRASEGQRPTYQGLYGLHEVVKDLWNQVIKLKTRSSIG